MENEMSQLHNLKLLGMSIFWSAFISASALRMRNRFIKIDGSSTVYPITQAVADQFQIAKKNAINVTVGIPAAAAVSRNSAAVRSILWIPPALSCKMRWRIASIPCAICGNTGSIWCLDCGDQPGKLLEHRKWLSQNWKKSGSLLRKVKSPDGIR